MGNAAHKTHAWTASAWTKWKRIEKEMREKCQSVCAWNPKRLQMYIFVTYVSVCDFSHHPIASRWNGRWESGASICVTHRPPSITNTTHMPVIKMEYFPPAPRCNLRYLIAAKENGLHLTCTHDRILRSEMNVECFIFSFSRDRGHGKCQMP